MRILEYFKDQEDIINEKNAICKNKKKTEKKFNQMLEDLNDITTKYTELLEQKSEQFDLYVKYQKQCEDLAKEKRSLKKQLAETNEKCNSLTDINAELAEKLKRLNSKITRLGKKDGKNEVIQQSK